MGGDTFIRRFAEVSSEDVGAVGGKSATLGELDDPEVRRVLARGRYRLGLGYTGRRDRDIARCGRTRRCVKRTATSLHSRLTLRAGEMFTSDGRGEKTEIPLIRIRSTRIPIRRDYITSVSVHPRPVCEDTGTPVQRSISDEVRRRQFAAGGNSRR